MSASPPPGRRGRARRGSLERPVSGRLYRATLVVPALALLVLAFSATRPAALAAPLLPPNFDGEATRELADQFSTQFPDRAPGGPGSIRARQWFRDQLAPYGLRSVTDTWTAQVPGLGRVRLQNVWAIAPGRSSDAIVVMAHRDDTGAGPGANDNASGTAALVELARGYAQPGAPAAQRVRSAHTVVFLSTDGGSFGGLGARRFARRAPFHILAAINLTAIGGAGPVRIAIAGDAPRSPAASLVVTAGRRVLEQTGKQTRRAGALEQLLDLAFPFTLYDQGPFVARGIPALTLTTAGERPPEAFTDRATSLKGGKLAATGRTVQELIGSLDQGLELAQGTTSFIWIGDRIVRGWAVELVLFGLLIPPFVAVVDLFARCRRKRIALLPAARALQSRLGFWGFLGIAFYVFRLLGAWPHGVPRPPNPAVASAGDWPVGTLILLAAVGLAGWVVARHRLVPRRPVAQDEQLAGEAVALIGLCIVSLLVLATNPFALIFFLPALHAWLWLPQVRNGRPPARALVFLLGLAGPLAIVLSLALRFGLGFDAPWYLVELVALNYVHVPAVAITLAGGACAAQLAAVETGRYAPYPSAGERPLRGPLRNAVRAVVLAVRARRRVVGQRRRAA
jgi:hypothetical protein